MIVTATQKAEYAKRERQSVRIRRGDPRNVSPSSRSDSDRLKRKSAGAQHAK